MDVDLAVVGRDPLFGDGGKRQIDAFVGAARHLGRSPQLFYDGHPGLRGPRWTWRRVEAIRTLTAGRRVRVPAAKDLWVVSTHATDGAPALHTGRAYSCWIGTTVGDEWAARRPGLGAVHRVLAGSSLGPLRSLERRVLRGARAVYATSEASRAGIAAASGRDDVGILPIPVDTAQFVPATEEAWSQTLASPTVVFVGRADDPRKNIGLLLDAAERLPHVHFSIVGAPPARGVPPNVELLGRVAELTPVLQGGTLFVLPSLQEGFGIVAAEALAAGLPVVTTPSGGPETLVRESGGGVVTGGFGAVELADAISSLLERPGELALLRARGRAYVEQHHSVAAFEQTLAAALGGAGA